MRGFARSILLALLLGFVVAAPQARAAGLNAVPQQKNTVPRQEIEAIIHDYLLQHPDVLIAALRAAQDKLDNDAAAKASDAVVQHRRELFADPTTPFGGKAHGDVTIVEFFDYRCPHCKEVEPSLEALLEQDPKLRLVYKEFPILGPVSVTAAHAALAAERQGKYDAFHTAMMAERGNISDATVYRVADAVGLDVAEIKHDMASPQVAQAIAANMKLADALDIHGTPAFIIGNKLVPGAVDLKSLKRMVAEARKQ